MSIQVRFPAVTVCNLNRVHCENLGLVLEENECPSGEADCLITRYNTQLNYSDLVEFAKLSGCPVSGPDSDGDGDNHLSLEPILDVDGNQVDKSTSTENVFLQSYMALDRDLRKNIGYQFDDFIRGCTFKGLNCRKET